MMAAILLLGTVVSLVLMGFVLASSRKLSNVVFAGIALCFAIWDASIAWFLTTSSSDEAAAAARAYYIAAGLFAALLMYFALIYPENRRVNRVTTSLILLGGVSVAILVLFYPGFIFSSVILDKGIYVVIDKVTYLAYSAYFTFFFFAGMAIALNKYRRYRGVLKAQSGLYAIGILLTSIPGFIGNLILPYYQNYNYVWIGPVASIFFLSLTGYSIIRHRMFDIKIVAARTFTYALIILILGSLYAGVLFAVSSFIIKDYTLTTSFLLTNAAIAVFFAFSYPVLRNFFNKITDRIFFRNDYQPADVLDQLGDIVSRYIDLDQLMSHATDLTDKYLRPSFVTMLLVDKQGSVVKVKTTKHQSAHHQVIDFVTVLPHSLSQVSILDGSIGHTILQEKARKYEVAVVVKLEASIGVIGYIIFGDKKSGSLYSTKDIELLHVYADELSLAVQNSLRFQEIKDLNHGLEDRVKEATIELRLSNKRLRAIDASKDEFISMASHQLRTPLTSIKGYVSMLLEGDLGDIKPEQRKALEEAYASSQRMVYLIGDFLNLSRLQTGRFELERTDISLPMIISEEISQLKESAKSRNIELHYEEPNDFPVVSVDETKIRQVMMNFIDNAIYYARSDGARIDISLLHYDNEIVFKVIDNGIGVPASQRPHLFTKFYRADNARKARPDGTGIGLYMAKKVIVAHGGSIIFESKENVGSTFGFKLPYSASK